ncbi:pentatricopeptide repeat-containing protein At3g26630, chloroplastic-like [Wolffia australiana]
MAAPCRSRLPPSPPLPPPSSPPPSPPPLLSLGAALRLLNSRCPSPRRLRQAHAHIVRRGLGRHPAVLSALLRRYAAHAHLRAAASAFSEFPFPPPPLAWNLMLRALTLAGRPADALRSFFLAMALAGIPPDRFTFPFAVKACSSAHDLRLGLQLHALALKSGLADDVFLQNALLHLYLRCHPGDALDAHLLFARMPRRNVVSWTTLISGLLARGDLDFARALFDEMPLRRNVVTWTALVNAYARSGRPERAFELFRRMQQENVRPNAFTVVALLIACTELGSAELGRLVHRYARRHGRLDAEPFVATALIDMYSRCGSLAEARRVFDDAPRRTLAVWNAMIASSGVHGHGAEAVSLFREMESSGLRPDNITFYGVLSACARSGMIREAAELSHLMTDKYGLFAPNALLPGPASQEDDNQEEEE